MTAPTKPVRGVLQQDGWVQEWTSMRGSRDTGHMNRHVHKVGGLGREAGDFRDFGAQRILLRLDPRLQL